MEKLLTIEEVAERLNIAPQTIRNNGAGTSTLPKVRLGRQVRFRLADVEKWINANVRMPFAPQATRQSRYR